MKLALTIPEKPGLIYLFPGFDFITLILAIVMLTGVVAKETYIDISLPDSEFRGENLGDENPVIVGVRYSAKGPSYYVARESIATENLEETIRAQATARSTRLVILRLDQSAPLWVEQELNDLCHRLGLTCKRAIRSAEPAAPATP